MAPATDPRNVYTEYLRRCNEYRFDELGDFVADDVDGPSGGLEQYVGKVREVVEAFPDYRWEVQQVLVDGQWIAARLYGSGTHAGTFRRIAATGRFIRTQELVMYEIRGGKIVNCWGDLHTTVRDALTSGAIDV